MLMIAFPAAFFLLIPVVWIEWWIARRLTGITSAAKIVGVAVANAVSMLAGWPLMWMALAALQIKLDPHGLSWPDSPIQKIASVTLEAAWLVPYSEHDLYWKIPIAAMVLMIPAFCISIVLERCVLHFLWRSEPSTERKRFVWRANIYSYALLMVFALIWLLYAIIDHHYHREV